MRPRAACLILLLLILSVQAAPRQQRPLADCPFSLSRIRTGAGSGFSIHVTLDDLGKTCRTSGTATLKIRTETGVLDREIRGNPSRVRVVAEVAPNRPASWRTGNGNGYKGPLRAEPAWHLGGICGPATVATISFQGIQRSLRLKAVPCTDPGHGSIAPLLDIMRPPGIISAQAVPEGQ
jgi:hypothetical protein